MHIALISSLD